MREEKKNIKSEDEKQVDTQIKERPTEDKQDETKQEKNAKKKIKIRTLLVLLVLGVFILGTSIIYRASYIESVEIGDEYAEVLTQNVKYKIYTGVINFVVIFFGVYITNNLIKKGLKKFFDDEKREMPKLPNKSLALVIALITSLVVSNMFLQKVILFVNAAQFGIPDPMFGMDVGFYMFQAPLIRTVIILWSYAYYINDNLCSSILYYCI